MPTNSPAGKTSGSGTDQVSIEVRLLGEEICFWQEMLASMEGTDLPRERVERVQQALALAQYRLGLAKSLSSH